MEFTRSPAKRSSYASETAKDTKTVTRIWSEDGWSYIPELKLREKFTELHFFRETWEGIISRPLHVETLIRATYSPLVWRETGKEFDEVYELKTTTPRTPSCISD
jgi:hypothetical protein